jgi:hypothetical protein
MKTIIYLHQNPLLEDINLLNATRPEVYDGFVYLWKCIPEDLYYIGSHKGKVGSDYRGSGARFKKIFECYGITQFQRVILDYVLDIKELKHAEQFWIDTFNATKSPRFLNIKNAIK